MWLRSERSRDNETQKDRSKMSFFRDILIENGAGGMQKDNSSHVENRMRALSLLCTEPSSIGMKVEE